MKGMFRWVVLVGLFVGSVCFAQSNAPVLVEDPVGQYVALGSNAVLSITVSGAEPLYFQWLESGVMISGATETNYPITNATTNDSGFYSVAVSNAFGVATSSVAEVTVQMSAINYSSLSNATLYASGAPYLLTCDVDMVNVVIEPGVRIEAVGNFGINVFGGLNAIGTEDLPIVFSSTNAATKWQGISFVASTNDSELTHCIVEKSQNSGIRINDASPILRHCEVKNNQAIYGAGIRITGSQPVTLEDCSINENTYYGHNPRGGGIHTTAPLSLIRCEVRNNVISDYQGNCSSGVNATTYGGGIYSSSDVFMDNVEVLYNTASSRGGSENSRGGGIYTSKNLHATNCIFLGNNAGAGGCNIGNGARGYGGGIYCGSTLDLKNCIVVNNSTRISNGAGGGIYAGNGLIENCTIAGNNRPGGVRFTGSIVNSILWGNSSYQYTGGASVSYSCVQGIGAGNNNFSDDPLFVYGDGGDYRLMANSLCIDAGSTNHVSTSTDIDGNPRILAGSVDLGAYEFLVKPTDPPTIVELTAESYVALGSNSTLNIWAVGGEPLNFQWFFNGTNIVGATGTNYPIVNATTNDSGFYSVVVSNAYGSVTSSVAEITVVPPPVITQQPQSQTMLVGSPIVQFIVAATSITEIAYQWLKDGEVIPGANSAFYTISPIRTNDLGSYVVEVSNFAGVTPSMEAVLSDGGQPPTPCVQCPNGIVAWWPGDGNADNLVGTNHGTLYNGATNLQGIVAEAFSFDGANDYFAAPDSSLYSPHVGADGEMTVMGWIKVPSLPSSERPFIAKGTSGAWEYALYLKNDGSVRFSIWTLSGSGYAAASGGSVAPNQWHHVVGTLRKGQFARIYLDGVLVGEDTTFSGNTGDGTAPFYIGRRGDGYYFPGLVDEVMLFDTALSSNEIASVYAAGVAGMCKNALPPTILDNPDDQYVALGSNMTSSVVAVGTAPLDYQWLFNGTNILVGATNISLFVTTAQTNDSGFYSVVVSNAYGAVTSSVAEITVVPLPVITVQPESQSWPLGYPVSFSVVADSLSPETYQWRLDGMDIPGATASTYSITSLKTNHLGSYSVVVSNLAGITNSTTATLSSRDPVFNNPEGFENGLGDWQIDNGVWQVGVPTSGPGSAHSGSKVAATVLNGNYPDYTDSRLISPEIVLSSVSGDERLQFRFWQAFYYPFATHANDWGEVQVSSYNAGTGAWSSWSRLSVTATDRSSSWWSRIALDLTSYAGQRIRIGFLHTADSYNGAGWYIDDIEIWKGVPEMSSFEGFEDGWGDWHTDHGLWQIGVPSSGPGSAHSGSKVAATVLNGNYPDYTDSRLISPEIVLPSVSGDERLQFRFWQAFYYPFATHANDWGEVQVSSYNAGTGAWSSWSRLSVTATDRSSSWWSRIALDLTSYAGQRIRIGFLHTADSYNGAGWYIDDIEIWKGVPEMSSFEGFEDGWGDWHTDHGLWQIGVPSSGPGSAHSGSKVAATVLNGNYPDYTDSRLISPEIVLPSVSGDERLQIRFWQWYNYPTHTYANDWGEVQVSAYNGGTGVWSSWSSLAITAPSRSSSDWSRIVLDLTSYAGARIRIAFQHIADSYDGPGWFIDGIEVGTISVPQIISEPQDQMTLVGRNLSFAVVATNKYLLSYQWQYNGSDIVGATNDTLVLTNVQVGASGNYRCVVSNVDTSVNTRDAVLAVHDIVGSAQELYELGFTEDGEYLIDPDGDAGEEPFNAYCLMSLAGGGWTKLTSTVADSVLNTNPDTGREYLYVKNGTPLWYRTPVSDLVWDWNSGKDLYGTYYYSDGTSEGSFNITPSSEHQRYGVGGSSGPGNRYKCLVYYSSYKDPSIAHVQLCQDRPGIFGGSCAGPVTVYIREQPEPVIPELLLELAADEIAENAVGSDIRCIVSRGGSFSNDLSVAVASSAPDEISVPASVVISSNANSAVFYAVVHDDAVVDGDQTVDLMVSAAGYVASSGTIAVVDNEVPSLSMALSATNAVEGEVVAGTVTRDFVTDQPVTVYLQSSSDVQCTVPASVTIPANTGSVAFACTVVDDEIAEIDLDVLIHANATGFDSVDQILRIEDDDVPGAYLTLSPEEVSEGAGLFACMGTLTRFGQTNGEVRIQLQASEDDALILPSEVVLADGEESVQFAIGTIDNAVVDGHRDVLVSGGVVIDSCGCTGSPSDGGMIEANLRILDDDGATLSVSASPANMPEGRDAAGLLSITHNTTLTEPLSVAISHDQPDEVTIPTNAVIPAGASSIQVPVETLDDGVEDGGKLVSVYVDADGYSSGTTWLMVSDQNHPDLVVSNVLASVALTTGEELELSAVLANIGFRDAGAGLPLAIHCSPGNYVNSSTFMFEYQTEAALPMGSNLTITAQATAPLTPGDYRIAVVADPDKLVKELNDANNIAWSATLSVSPSYTASAETDVETAMDSDVIPITGSATLPDGMSPAANVDVDVYVVVNGIRRVISVQSDAEGLFETEFVPLPGEAGHYSIGACYPGLGSTVEQDSFEILGMGRTSSGHIIWDMTVGDVISNGTINIRNRSQAELTNLSVEILEVPTNCNLELTLPATLPGGSVIPLGYTVEATAVSEGSDYEKILIRITTDEGVVLEIPCWFYSECEHALLRTVPTRLDTTMTRDIPRLVEFSVYNAGAGDSGLVSVDIPSVDWMRVVGGQYIDNLTNGASATITLELKADESVPLNAPLNGSIAINAENADGIRVPFRFESVSDETGGLLIDVVDEYTYYVESSPHVSNATVKVRNPYTGATVAQGMTAPDGTFQVSDLPVGRYTVAVSANRHSSWNGVVEIAPGRTTAETVFLSYQAITYRWEVKKVELEDRYEIVLKTEYETSVPKPVVTIDVPKSLPDLDYGESHVFEAVINNHGLISAHEVSIILPEHPRYEFESMVSQISVLPAKSSVRVPVLMKRPADEPMSIALAEASDSDDTKPCSGIIKTYYVYYCAGWFVDGHWELAFSIPITYNHCKGSSSGSGGDGGSRWPTPIPPNTGGSGSVLPPHRDGGGNGEAGSQITVPGIPPLHEDSECDPCFGQLFKASTGCLPGVGMVWSVWDYLSCQREALNGNGSPWQCFWDYASGEVLGEIIGSLPGGSAISCVKSIFDAVAGCTRITTIPMGENGDIFAMQAFGDIYVLPASAADESGDDFEQISSYLEAYISFLDNNLDMTYFVFGDSKWRGEDYIGEFYGQFLAKLDGQTKKIAAQDLENLSSSFIGSKVESSDIIAFGERWNRSIDYWDAGYEYGYQLPVGWNTNFIDMAVVSNYASAMNDSMDFATAESFSNVVEMAEDAYTYVENFLEANRGSVCAKVSMNITQTATMTREAFEGVLTIFNGHETDAMQDVQLELRVTDENGDVCNDLFEISTESLVALTDIDGTGSLAGNTEGAATILFIPEHGAAPVYAKTYRFGGTLSYVDPFTGEQVVVDLFPVALEVNPCPNLELHYFLQRDVMGDDPLTEDVVEPMVPAELAVLVCNKGYGTANNFRIDSAQPQIVENEKGLLIDFALYNSALNGFEEAIGLEEVNLGDIGAQESALAQWWLTASLQGHFTSMDANFTHLNSSGNPDISLIESVDIHELIRSVEVDGHDLPSFLVTARDVKDLPDELYFPDGTIADVFHATTSASNTPVGIVSTSIVTVVAGDAGWHYASLPDPGGGNYEIVQIMRSDGSELPLRNCWLTDRTLPDGGDPVYEHRLHLLDEFGLSGTNTYTIEWEATDTNPPAVERFEGIASGEVLTSALDSIDVVFTEPIDPASFTVTDLSLRHQGSGIAVSNLNVSGIDELRYRIGNLAAVAVQDGYYELTVQAAGVTDPVGNPGTHGKSISWIAASMAPAVVEVLNLEEGAVVTNVDSIIVRFSEPLEPGSFTADDIALQGESISNLSVVVIDDLNTLYEVDGFSGSMESNGLYGLEIDTRGVESALGNTGLVVFALSWSIDRVPPEVVLVKEVPPAGLEGEYNIRLEFSETIPYDTVSLAAIDLLRDSVSVPGVAGTASLEKTDDATYLVSGLGALSMDDGHYEVVFNAGSITDIAGNPGVGFSSVSWHTDNTPPEELADLSISPDTGISDSDGITAVDAFSLAATLPETNLHVEVYEEVLVGDPSLLAELDPVSTLLDVPLSFDRGGHLDLLVRCSDAAGNTSDSRFPVFIDNIDLQAELSGVPEDPEVAVDALTIVFSDEIIEAEFTSASLSLTLDGTSLSVAGISIAKTGAREFEVSGLAATVGGTYELSVDLGGLHEKLSGRSGSGLVAVQWEHEAADAEPPYITDIRIDGLTNQIGYVYISKIDVVFSEAVNMPELIGNGLIENAVRIMDMQDGNPTGSVVTGADTFDWATQSNTLSWNLTDYEFSDGRKLFYADSRLIADLAGNALAVASNTPTVGFGVPSFTNSGTLATVEAYAAPVWYDFDADGVADLLVGEKATASNAMIRLYVNQGTTNTPSFVSYEHLMINDVPFTIPANGCLGVSFRLADLTGDGVDDLVTGRSDGSVWLYEMISQASNNWQTMDAVEIWSNTNSLAARAMVDVVDVDADGDQEVLLGRMDGGIQVLEYSIASNTCSAFSLIGADDVPLAVAGGRAAPSMMDLTGDAVPDLAVGDSGGDLWAHLGGANGLNSHAFRLADVPIGASRSRPFTSDVNTDGVVDVLLGMASGEVNLLQGVRPQNHAMEFEFNVVPIYKLTVTSGTGGHVDPEGEIIAFGGTYHIFNMVPEPYWHVEEVWADGIPKGAVSSYTFFDVQADGLLHAQFARNMVTNAPADVPEEWLAQHGWTNNLSAAVTNDPDGDGFATWQEYVVGSSPTNKSSKFRITEFRRLESGEFLVSWEPSVSNRQYRVMQAGAPGGPYAESLATVTGPANSATVSASNDCGMLRLQVEMKDAPPQWIVMAFAGDHGTISPSGLQYVTHGSNTLSFSLTPEEWYHVADVKTNGVSAGAMDSLVLSNITDNIGIRAEFALTMETNAPVDVSHRWLAEYGWTNDLATVVTNDADGDGFATWKEYLAGSEPTNKASYFRITQIRNLEGDLLVSWTPSVANRRYKLMQAPALGSPFSEVLATLEGPANSVKVPASLAVGMLRLEVELYQSPPKWVVLSTASGGGTISPSGIQYVTYGSNSLSFAIAPRAWHHTVDVVTNGISAGTPGLLELDNITDNILITAEFAPNMVTNAPVQVPEYWMANHGITSGFAAAITNDADADGFATWQEFVAGSEPTNAASYFRITRNEVVSNTWVVEWEPSIPGRTYTPVVMDLSGGTNTPLPEIQGPFNVVSNNIESASGLMKVDVQVSRPAE
ncbi:Bacillopeptidase F [Pontiella desulfatans]|uniref:Bacillopeptidase F n=1 Tax=Pontiella desulfatans TaxID=2750659 RepID=A0A6C2UA00_PONDE|nr:immunoglobulin domain-containing protein [Pontiella desulfatans]VGO16683.1 Bacillopeptidase F [Pontiella desulfatans]